jgi:SAM-dependent methyltransferase
MIRTSHYNQTTSMSNGLSLSAARTLIRWSQGTRFGGLGGYSPEAFGQRGDSRPFPQGERELTYFEDFFQFFSRKRVEDAVRGRRLLDFGSGYGGRTSEYVRKLGAAEAWGVEPVPRHVELAEGFARSLGVSNCHFRLCGDTDIPMDDASVDVVVSYDVLEHVQDPRLSMAEIHRVLVPGGVAFLAFPLYHGAQSHHLDYITRLPGLHWLFSPDTLVSAVNTFLAVEDGTKKYGTGIQPRPKLSYDQKRKVLPTLNGLTGNAFRAMLNSFEVVDLRFRPILGHRRVLGAPIRALFALGLSGRLRDALATNCVCELRKPF